MRCFAVGLILGIKVLQGHVADREVCTIISGSIPYAKIQSWELLAVIVDVASGTHNFCQMTDFPVGLWRSYLGG